jgi:formylglycine-generating enzyme required for sulfatase activity
MVMVPAGSFTMGSPLSEKNRNVNEGPQRRVTFERPFVVGKYALTFEEWDACVADGGCDGYRPDDRGWGRARRPVINVSWNDVQAYVKWLSGKTGKSYRLLTEAEREYVTRAGTTTPFWWGDSISRQQANYDGAAGAGTVPVDSFQPNPWGLYQVHGNVWEWTQDCMHPDYNGAPLDGSVAWITGAECSARRIRGGAWNFHDGSSARAASRFAVTVDSRTDWLGFRVGRTLTP